MRICHHLFCLSSHGDAHLQLWYLVFFPKCLCNSLIHLNLYYQVLNIADKSVSPVTNCTHTAVGIIKRIKPELKWHCKVNSFFYGILRMAFYD